MGGRKSIHAWRQHTTDSLFHSFTPSLFHARPLSLFHPLTPTLTLSLTRYVNRGRLITPVSPGDPARVLRCSRTISSVNSGTNSSARVRGSFSCSHPVRGGDKSNIGQPQQGNSVVVVVVVEKCAGMAAGAAAGRAREWVSAFEHETVLVNTHTTERANRVCLLRTQFSQHVGGCMTPPSFTLTGCTCDCNPHHKAYSTHQHFPPSTLPRPSQRH